MEKLNEKEKKRIGYKILARYARNDIDPESWEGKQSESYEQKYFEVLRELESKKPCEKLSKKSVYKKYIDEINWNSFVCPICSKKGYKSKVDYLLHWKENHLIKYGEFFTEFYYKVYPQYLLQIKENLMRKKEEEIKKSLEGDLWRQALRTPEHREEALTKYSIMLARSEFKDMVHDVKSGKCGACGSSVPFVTMDLKTGKIDQESATYTILDHWDQQIKLGSKDHEDLKDRYFSLGRLVLNSEIPKRYSKPESLSKDKDDTILGALKVEEELSEKKQGIDKNSKKLITSFLKTNPELDKHVKAVLSKKKGNLRRKTR